MDPAAIDPYRLRELILAHLDGVMDESGRVELEAALNRDQVARQIFVEQLRLEGALRLMRPEVVRRSVAGRWRRAAGLAATAAGLLIGLLAWQGWRRPQVPADDPVASLAQSGPLSLAGEETAVAERGGADVPETRSTGRRVVVRVDRGQQPQTVVSALRPGDAIARIGPQHAHQYDSLDPGRSYAIRVLPMRR